ncbi:hypothetical protein M0R72_22065, partial [Candidatus Pacearchaeota archaeon]|nr:hypothetical protein [Candidatus Pacearchaeota archaeon]
ARQFQVDEIEVLRIIGIFFNQTSARDEDLVRLLFGLAREFVPLGVDLVGATRFLAALLDFGLLPGDIEMQISGMNRVGKRMMSKQFQDRIRDLGKISC